MAKITAYYSLDMSSIDFSNLTYGTPAVATSSLYKLAYSGGYLDVFTGHGFKYNVYDIPTAGTMTDFAEYYYSKKSFDISGVSISAVKLVDVAFTSTLNDDYNLIIKVLKGNDTIIGSKYGDLLFGAEGNDTIKGNGGGDILISGPGKDTLTGGAGADQFVFGSVNQSTVAAKNQDTILDFTHADHIDLSIIDANRRTGADNDFAFIGSHKFTGHAGELRFDKLKSDTYVYGDVNGDKKADFAIHLDDAIKLEKGDFYL